MKYQLMPLAVGAALLGMSVSGQAADLPVKAPPAPLPPPFSWTGLYLGANAGGAWAHRNITDTITGLNFGRSSDGVFIAGGQAGFNYQVGSFVFGVEGDFDWAGNNNHGAGVIVPGVGTLVVNANDKWISTVAARLGIAYDHWLFYGKGGVGWVGANHFTITNITTGNSVIFGGDRSANGFVAGAGIEYAFTNNWTVKVEYDFIGLSNRTFVVPAGAPFLAGDVFTTRDRNVQEVKVGLNYLFNFGGPVY